jgi:hypothetical protein
MAGSVGLMREQRMRRSRLQLPRRPVAPRICAPSRDRGAPPVGDRTTAVGNGAAPERPVAPIGGAISARHGARNVGKTSPGISGDESKQKKGS